MEAVALYDFQATQRDELSFNRGDLLKVRLLMIGELVVDHINYLLIIKTPYYKIIPNFKLLENPLNSI